MKVAVVSDTHGYSYDLNGVIKIIQDTDILIHLGDVVEDVEVLRRGYKGKVINVRGNCDFTSFISVERVEELEGVKILMTHGHKYDVKNSLLALKYRAEELGVNIVLFGHTHKALELFEGGIWYVNPGSPSLPITRQKTVAILEINDKTPKISFRTIV